MIVSMVPLSHPVAAPECFPSSRQARPSAGSRVKIKLQRRVLAFFRGFQREVGQEAQQAAHQTSSSQRSHSTTPRGNTYTRARIAQLYEMHRKGAFKGKEMEWNRIENDFIRAQREGRVTDMYSYFTK